MKQAGQLAAVVAEVEAGIVGEPGRHRIQRGADGHGHDQRVEVSPEFASALEMGEQLLESGDSGVADRQVVERAAVGAAGVQRDLHGRQHVVAVLPDEGQVALDVGAEHARAGRLGFQPGSQVAAAFRGQLGDQLSDQVVLAAEVIQDHALAGAGPLGDAGQGGPPVTKLGDGVDGGRHDLRPPRGLGEGPVRRLPLTGRSDF
jgi:hypothetical protein